jgi:hypothetical protein
MARRESSGQRSEAPDTSDSAPRAPIGGGFESAAAGLKGLAGGVGAAADPGLAAAVLRLQSAAGNRAVAAQLARSPFDPPAVAAPPANPPAAAAGAVPGRSRVLGAPAPVQAVDPGDGVRPAVDIAADASTVSVTLVLRNFNLPQSGDASTIDFLHEPGVSIQVTPGNLPEPVVQAAIAAMNVHLRRHGRDIAELSVNPQASLGADGTPSAGVSAQAELHVTSSFSITVSTSASVRPHQDEPDEGSLRVTPPNSPVDLTWSPFSVGVLFHLDARDPAHEGGEGPDYAALRDDARVITWVVNQLDRADFASRGAGDLDVSTFVTQLLDAMRAAGGEEAQWAIHLGILQVGDIPPGLSRGLTRAAQLIAGADPTLSRLRRVRVSMFNLPPSGEGAERVVRWTLLPLEGRAVTPAAAP